MGGKARLRKWLITHFPKSGRKYIEPFCGLGNVFFQAKKDLNFQEWHLSDINCFIESLVVANLDELPISVSKEEFNYWKTVNSDIAKLIEPQITFAGKGYKSGFSGGHVSHPPYNGNLYRIKCEEARRLLANVNIKNQSWNEIDYESLTFDDFVYFDPPYYGTKSSYPNINHEELVDTLNKTNFRWAISGYDNDLYAKLKFTNRYEKERNSEIKGCNTGKREPVKEVLWTNS